jgi:hypothetical protein
MAHFPPPNYCSRSTLEESLNPWEVCSVENTFDIMKVLANDSLAWVETAEELSAARVRVWELLADSPGEYIVFNQETKTLVAHFCIHEAPQTPEWWRRDDDGLEGLQPAVATTDDYDEYSEDEFEVEPAVAAVA